MTVVRFMAAEPVGVNDLYQPGLAFTRGGGRRATIRKTPKGEAFCLRLLVAARAAWRRLRRVALGGDASERIPVSVSIWLAFPTYANDIDGPIKSCLDSLQHSGIVWNDNRVDELHVYRLPPDAARPRVEVAVQEITEEENEA
jgi:Holliday junction resolvase RusA-like endonuclease